MMDRSPKVQEIRKKKMQCNWFKKKMGTEREGIRLKKEGSNSKTESRSEILQNRAKVQRIVREKVSFIDFENKMMKNSKEKFTFFVVKSEKEFIDTILRRQKVIGDCFLKNKLAIYSEGDPAFLDDLSAVL